MQLGCECDCQVTIGKFVVELDGCRANELSTDVIWSGCIADSRSQQLHIVYYYYSLILLCFLKILLFRHLVYLNPIVPYYSRTFSSGNAPTASQSVDSVYGFTVLSSRDRNNIHHFDLVRTSPPPLPPHLAAQSSSQSSSPYRQIYANSSIDDNSSINDDINNHRLGGSTFGLPNTCAACTSPSCICGQTLKCPKGSCCFMIDEVVMCCADSPPSINPTFVCAQ